MAFFKRLNKKFDTLSALLGVAVLFQYAPLVMKAHEQNPEAFSGVRSTISAVADQAEMQSPFARKVRHVSVEGFGLFTAASIALHALRGRPD